MSLPCPQIDLQYPWRGKGNPLEKQSMPSFSDVLIASIRAESETRAWFDDTLKYQYVKQSRMPLGWPKVSQDAFESAFCVPCWGQSGVFACFQMVLY